MLTKLPDSIIEFCICQFLTNEEHEILADLLKNPDLSYINKIFNYKDIRLDNKIYCKKVTGLCEIDSLEFEKKFPNAKIVKFTNHFDQKIEPGTLLNVRTLTFGTYFNQKIEPGTLLNVKTLTFGKHFDQKIEPGTLLNIKTLEFGHDFNQSLFVGKGIKILPGVRKIVFGENYNQILPNLYEYFPNLEEITIPKSYKFWIIGIVKINRI